MEQNITIAESKVSSHPAEFSVSAGYDSGWVSATNATNTNLIFNHNLTKIPKQMSIMFSADQETVYPLIWPWGSDTSGNPVSIWANQNTVTLSIFSGAPLHGAWSGATGAWTTWNTGYFRVFASL